MNAFMVKKFIENYSMALRSSYCIINNNSKHKTNQQKLAALMHIYKYIHPHDWEYEVVSRLY